MIELRTEFAEKWPPDGWDGRYRVCGERQMNSSRRLVMAAFSIGLILPALIACGGGDSEAPPGQSRELTRAVETAQKSLDSGKVVEAAQQFDAAIEQGASSAEAYGGRGATRIQQADYSGAIADLTRAIELDARNDTHLENRAIAQIELFKKGGDSALLAQAINDADASARLKPDRIGPIFARAEAYFLSKEYQKALADLNECVKRSDRFRRAWLLKGMTNVALGRTADARSDFEMVVKLDPTGQEGTQAQAELAKLK
jgi:tetratricopeptide (TPR) repeat protein